MKLALTLLVLVGLPLSASAQDAESYRNGDVPGTVAAFRAGRERAPTSDAMIIVRSLGRAGTDLRSSIMPRMTIIVSPTRMPASCLSRLMMSTSTPPE